MCSSCYSNPAWLHMPSAVLLNWFTPNILLLNHSFACNHPYKVYIKMLHSAAIWKPVAQKIKGRDPIWGTVFFPCIFTSPRLLGRGRYSFQKAKTIRLEIANWQFFISMVFGSSGEIIDVNIVHAFRRSSQWFLVFAHSPRLPEVQMFLQGKVAAARHVHSSREREKLAGTKEVDVLITRK